MKRSLTRCVVSVVAVGVVAAGGAAAAAAPGSPVAPSDVVGASGLTVVAQAPPAWPTHRAFDVQIVVRNPSQQLFCAPFHVTLTWQATGARRHVESMSAGNDAGSATVALHVAAATVLAGPLHYAVSATQRCGLIQRTSTYAGRAPSSGWNTVLIVG